MEFHEHLYWCSIISNTFLIKTLTHLIFGISRTLVVISAASGAIFSIFSRIDQNSLFLDSMPFLAKRDKITYNSSFKTAFNNFYFKIIKLKQRYDKFLLKKTNTNFSILYYLRQVKFSEEPCLHLMREKLKWYKAIQITVCILSL